VQKSAFSTTITALPEKGLFSARTKPLYLFFMCPQTLVGQVIVFCGLPGCEAGRFRARHSHGNRSSLVVKASPENHAMRLPANVAPVAGVTRYRGLGRILRQRRLSAGSRVAMTARGSETSYHKKLPAPGDEAQASHWMVMVLSKSPLQKGSLAFRHYGLAVASVAIALGPALLLQDYKFRDVEFPLFLFAVALTAWYAGIGPAILSVVLSTLCFDYFFTEPLYSLYFTLADVPAVIIFVSLAALVAWFSSVRRRVEQQLLQARDELEVEVAERTQQASLLNLTHDTIFVRDMGDIITYWNRGAQEMYGWTAEEAIGKRSHDLLRTAFPLPVDDITAALLQTGRWEGELTHTKGDGTKLVVASRWSLRRDDLGRPVAVLETNNDITERKHREEEIRCLNLDLATRSTELEAINKELEAFAYSVSHDLRAPLRHMVGFTELLHKKESSVLDDKSRRYMAIILESAKRMGNLIDDLLAFSRIGRVETRKSLVSLEQLLKEALNEVRQDTDGRNIVWKIGTLPDFYGDRSMLKLVLVNLLSNAVKFTRTRAQAEIEIGCSEGGNGEVVVFVRDNGVGFDMRYINKLFGVFQRLHSPQSFEGTGIGLATVQRILHRHGGKIWAEGLVDSGATFYFSAPMHQ
jgi:PAS domain S-box-containing protein